MADDIVTRLRTQRDEDGYCVICGDGRWESHFPKCLMCEAADEIERLRAAGDALVAAIRSHDLREDHIKAWVEARRG